MRETCGWVGGGGGVELPVSDSTELFQSMHQKACLCRYQCQINTFHAPGLRYCPFLDYIMVRSMTTFSNANGLRYCTALGYVSVRSGLLSCTPTGYIIVYPRTTLLYVLQLRYCTPLTLRYYTLLDYVIVQSMTTFVYVHGLRYCKPMDYVIGHRMTTF